MQWSLPCQHHRTLKHTLWPHLTFSLATPYHLIDKPYTTFTTALISLTNTLATPYQHTGHPLPTHWLPPTNTLVVPYQHIGYPLPTHWLPLTNTLATPYQHTGRPLPTHWSSLTNTLVVPYQHTGRPLPTHWSSLTNTLVVPYQHTGRPLPTHWTITYHHLDHTLPSHCLSTGLAYTRHETNSPQPDTHFLNEESELLHCLSLVLVLAGHSHVFYRVLEELGHLDLHLQLLLLSRLLTQTW